jgi:dTDP-4-dehydrorhamnose reductase
MNILLLGADGQLGRRLRDAMARMGSVITTTRSGGDVPCDLQDLDALRALLAAVQPALIVNAAAYTLVDLAERNQGLAMRINADVPGILGEYAARAGAGVMHFSTDYVFDGYATVPYQETDAAGPLGAYGASKLEGERRLSASGCEFLTLRTAWVYGHDGRNFLTTMLRLARERDELKVVGDQVGTPTSAAFLAASTGTIAAAWRARGNADRAAASGIYHLTAAGQTTWAGFATAIMDEAVNAGVLRSAPRVQAIPSAEYPTPATRPRWSVLSTRKVEERFGIQPPAWRAALRSELALLDRHHA